jgi:hypothetical protein
MIAVIAVAVTVASLFGKLTTTRGGPGPVQS